MKKLILLIIVIMPLAVNAQSNNQNYIKEIQYLDSAGTGKMTKLSYFDGLGNQIETVTSGPEPNNKIYTFRTYDSKGRESRDYLSTPANTDFEFKNIQDLQSISDNYYSDETAYVQNHYDAVDRIVAEDIPGSLWRKNDRKNITTYSMNTDADKVLHYDVNVEPINAGGIPLYPINTRPLYPINRNPGSGLIKISPSPINICPKEGQTEIHSSVLVKPENTSYKYYPSGSLTKEIKFDADSNMVTIFRDLDGNTILERRNIGDTYFVYNSIGQLRYVLSPLYQSSDDENLYVYEYVYDYRDNLVKKIIPGGEFSQYWYDNENHLVFFQDAQLRSKGLYRFNLYDNYGRLAILGTCSNCNRNIDNMEVNVTLSGLPISAGFLNTGYILNNSGLITESGSTIEKVNYYDSYDFLLGPYKNEFDKLSAKTDNHACGLLSGSVLGTSNGQYIYTVNYYDEKGNLVNCLSKGLEDYTAKISNVYTFTNQLKSSLTDVNVKYGESFKVNVSNVYNANNDKLNSVTLSLSHGLDPVSTEFNYQYDELNRLSSIIRPGSVGNISYKYDIHGWPTDIETGSFKEQLFYADGLGKPCFNGNISCMKWSDKSYNQLRGYRFYYDKLNRLVNAIYGEQQGLDNGIDRYDEHLEYDLNGNIIGMQRRGKRQDGQYGNIDNLHFRLNGNQLSSVSDDADKLLYEGALDFNGAANGQSEYSYNNSGSIISDTGRGIAMIEYDNNNDPYRIQFTNGNVIKYVYSFDGQKLRTVYYTAMPDITVAVGSTHQLTKSEIQSADSTDYLLNGNLLLKNGRIDKYLFGGGYCQADKYYVCLAKPALPIWEDGADSITIQDALDDYRKRLAQWEATYEANELKDAFFFLYFNKDHLGSNREVIYENGKISQVTNYYPFGTPYCDNVSTINSDNQPFKYNGKEFDKMYGLNTFDYGGRQYNSIVPTWDRIDPLAEKHYNVSPYVYCADNPVNAVDPDGKETQYFLWTPYNRGTNYLIQNNKTMENVLKAIDIIRQTDYGSNFFNSFEKGGANFAYKLDINTIHLTVDQLVNDNSGSSSIFGNSDLDYDDENDRIKFELTVNDSEKGVGEILQTICHEISDHLNTPNINSAINVFEKNGKGKSGFDKAYRLFYKDSAHKQHRQQDEHQGNPWKYYEQLMDQIIKRHPEYKGDFENGMNNNHENVYNGE